MSKRSIVALLVVAAGLTLQGQAPAFQLSCMFWVSAESQPPPGRSLQMGACFYVDAVAPGYVVRVDGGPWQPVQAFKCRPGFWNGAATFNCHARYARLYYGIDRTFQLARADRLEVMSDVTTSRLVKDWIDGYASDDPRFPKFDEPMVPGYNDLVDAEGLPPATPVDTRIVR